MSYACLGLVQPKVDVRKVNFYIEKSNNGHGKNLIKRSKRMNMDLLKPRTVQAINTKMSKTTLKKHSLKKRRRLSKMILKKYSLQMMRRPKQKKYSLQIMRRP